jgi:hypothetical protein
MYFLLTFCYSRVKRVKIIKRRRKRLFQIISTGSSKHDLSSITIQKDLESGDPIDLDR